MFFSSPVAPTIQGAVVDQRQLWKSPSSAEAAGHTLVVRRGYRANSSVLHALLTKVAEEMLVVCLEDSFHYFSVHPTFCNFVVELFIDQFCEISFQIVAYIGFVPRSLCVVNSWSRKS